MVSEKKVACMVRSRAIGDFSHVTWCAPSADAVLACLVARLKLSNPLFLYANWKNSSWVHPMWSPRQAKLCQICQNRKKTIFSVNVSSTCGSQKKTFPIPPHPILFWAFDPTCRFGTCVDLVILFTTFRQHTSATGLHMAIGRNDQLRHSFRRSNCGRPSSAAAGQTPHVADLDNLCTASLHRLLVGRN